MQSYDLMFSEDTDFTYLKTILPLLYGNVGKRFYRVDLTNDQLHFIKLAFKVEVL